jgi:hypothetical protein
MAEEKEERILRKVIAEVQRINDKCLVRALSFDVRGDPVDGVDEYEMTITLRYRERS